MVKNEFENLARESAATLEKLKSPSGNFDDAMLALHWNEAARTWDKIAWCDFMRFKTFGDEFRPLAGIGAGNHWFVVCVVDDQQNLFNVLPHRYLIHHDGRIVDDGYFGVLSGAETKRYKALNKRHYQYPQIHPLNEKEQTEFDAIRDRLWRSWLPPRDAAMMLIRDLPAFPTSSPDRPGLAFLAAFGITDQNQSAN